MDNEMEYRVPAKVLTNRDPIILNKLSLREFFQWAIFFILIYLSFNALPLDFTFKLVIGAAVGTFGALFIHAPINGLAGIEWVYIYLRFAAEKKRHKTVPPLTIEPGRKPVFNVSMSLSFNADASNSNNSNSNNHSTGQVVNHSNSTGKEIAENVNSQ